MRLRTTVFLSILSLLTVAACNKSNPQASQGGPGGAGRPAVAAVPVSVAPVLRQDVPIILTGLGTVQAYNTVTLKTRVDGQIMSVHFREGQEVRKGLVLAVIDPRPYEVALETAKPIVKTPARHGKPAAAKKGVAQTVTPVTSHQNRPESTLP